VILAANNQSEYPNFRSGWRREKGGAVRAAGPAQGAQDAHGGEAERGDPRALAAGRAGRAELAASAARAARAGQLHGLPGGAHRRPGARAARAGLGTRGDHDLHLRNG